MSRHRLEAYLDKVFGFSALVDALPEGREFPQHRWKKVFDAVFLGAAMQIPSLLQIEAECCQGALAKRMGPISDDTGMLADLWGPIWLTANPFVRVADNPLEAVAKHCADLRGLD